LCPENAEQKQLLVDAGLWAHYCHSVSSLTQSFRQFTQRTLAAFKQLSHSSSVSSADLEAALATLNRSYIDAHAATLALYTAQACSISSHIDIDRGTHDLGKAVPSSELPTKAKTRVKAVRSLTTKRPTELSRQRSKRGGRTAFPSRSTGALRVWFRSHLRSPYPSEREKAKLSKASGMNVEQVANW